MRSREEMESLILAAGHSELKEIFLTEREIRILIDCSRGSIRTLFRWTC